MRARVFQPAKTAVSSGRFKTRSWIVEFEPQSPKAADRLIGWIGSDDTQQQVTLKFPTREAAVAYLQKRQIAYSLDEPQSPETKPKSYADNFLRRI